MPSRLPPSPTACSLDTPGPRLLTVRGAHVTASLARHVGPLIARRAAGRPIERRELAMPLARAFEGLGATFVKLGQLIASSSTLFGDDMAHAFRTFLDDGPEVPFPWIESELRRATGRSLEETFAYLDPRPIGQASLAVVHRGLLRDGRDVAVKILRPRIEETVAADLAIMRQSFKALAPALGPGITSALIDLLDDLRRQLGEELDLRNEAAAMAYFRELLTDDAALVVVPKPDLSLSSKRVLVMDHLDGVAIDDADAVEIHGHDGGAAVEQAMRAWFFTTLTKGVFHGDVHAGNVLVLQDGRVGVIDWGIVGRLSAESHWLLRRFFAANLGDETALEELVSHLTDVLAAGAGDRASHIEPAAIRIALRDQLGAVLTAPFGELNLSELITTLYAGLRPAQPKAKPRAHRRLATLRRVSPRVGVMDESMMLMAKQLAYFERYGRLYLSERSVLQDRDWFRSLLESRPDAPRQTLAAERRTPRA